MGGSADHHGRIHCSIRGERGLQDELQGHQRRTASERNIASPFLAHIVACFQLGFCPLPRV